VAGLTGSNGQPGLQGAQGIPGVQGIAGSQGPKGEPGTPGGFANITELEIENYITNGAIDLASGSTVGGEAISSGSHTTELEWLSVLNRPTGLDDGDDDTLADLVCADGQIPRWVAISSTWSCSDDNDTQLIESQVEQYITNGIIDLEAGTTVGGQDIATGSHTSVLA
jgi:hypothetical protein